MGRGTDAERIAALEREVAELKRRLALVEWRAEARARITFSGPPQPMHPQPICPNNPPDIWANVEHSH